jgi:hypothetical protein
MSVQRSPAVVALIAALAATACGCNNARMVSWNNTTSLGVVAIPYNDNSWPDKNRDHAEALMKEKCPHGYTVMNEEEVVLGGEVLHSVERVGYMRVRETSFEQRKEWRITFRSADAPAVVVAPPPPSPVVQTGAVVPMAPPPVSVVTPPTPPSLPPQPIPVGQ